VNATLGQCKGALAACGRAAVLYHQGTSMHRGTCARTSVVNRHLLLLSLLLLAPLSARSAEFQFKDGDRAVLVGSTLIEREQKYGYWELALTTRHPDKNLTFRNVGWSGDTVWGEARVGFDLDNPRKGFERLRDAVLEQKPTVIIVGYGTNESFAGEAGLPRFREGLNALLDSFAPMKARIVLLAPMRLECHPPMLPDPTTQNRNIEAYAAAIRDIARQRGCAFADLSPPATEKPAALTDNGIHLTAFGYQYTAARLLQALCPEKLQSPLPLESYKLSEKAEKLRQAIVEKNELFFHRFRPQNETYLFGFRKYEQGKNAVEVPQFDALIEAKEKEIAKQR
jgi:lysophospholipase L1-like esterase